MHDLVPAAHRALRRVDAQDSAVPGKLVTDGDRVRVRVDAEAVPDVLWAFAEAEHIAGVRDVLRRADGQDALLPWCTDRVEAFLGRRVAAELALAPGETVTLVGSLLRGLGEIGDATIHGSWWLTDDMRPLFVPGEGTACTVASTAIVERLREACTDRAMERLLAEVAQMPDDARMLLRNLERWERELTELAAPRPLRSAELAPARVDAIPAHRALLPEVVRQVTSQRQGRRRADAERARAATVKRTWRRLESADVLSVIAAGVRSTGARLREKVPVLPSRTVTGSPQNRTARRGRMLFVGAGAAAIVLIGGLLWPSDEHDVSSAVEKPVPASAAPTDAADGPTPLQSDQETEEATGSADHPAGGRPEERAQASVVDAAAELLSEIGECAHRQEGVCAEAIVEGAGETVMTRLGDDVRGRAPALVDDYGDVAVVRLSEGRTHGEQMLVLVVQNDGWLVRDVYDVAGQPSVEG